MVRRTLWANAVDQVLAIEELIQIPGDPPTVENQITWPMTDYQGTTRNVIQYNSGADDLIQQVSYDTFGMPEDNLGGMGDAEMLPFYAGRDYDTVTGLYNNRARWYNPENGRFTSEDSWGFAAGDANLYRYAGNSPTMATDPSGHYVESGWDAFSIGVGVVSAGHSIYSIATTGEGWGNLGLDAIGIVADVGALILPGVPGGAGVAIKGSRLGRAGQRVVSTINKSEMIVRGTNYVGQSQTALTGIRTLRYGSEVIDVSQAGYYGYQGYQSEGLTLNTSLNIAFAGMGASARGMGIATESGLIQRNGRKIGLGRWDDSIPATRATRGKRGEFWDLVDADPNIRHLSDGKQGLGHKVFGGISEELSSNAYAAEVLRRTEKFLHSSDAESIVFDLRRMEKAARSYPTKVGFYNKSVGYLARKELEMILNSPELFKKTSFIGNTVSAHGKVFQRSRYMSTEKISAMAQAMRDIYL